MLLSQLGYSGCFLTPTDKQLPEMQTLIDGYIWVLVELDKCPGAYAIQGHVDSSGTEFPAKSMKGAATPPARQVYEGRRKCV
jgi:hypothetical protein